MPTLHVLTGLEQPRLHLWRDKTVQGSAQLAYDVESSGLDAHGLHAFTAILDTQLRGNVNALVHADTNRESNHHRKTLPRTAQYRFPDELWCAHGAARVLTENPFTAAHAHIRIHLITALHYRHGELFIWSPLQADRRV